jgi:soluble lytic murein transglycosylase-like protein
MRTSRQPGWPAQTSRIGTALLGIAAASAVSPAFATDCVSSRGMIETVRPCEASAIDYANLPRSVSVQMPGSTRRHQAAQAVRGTARSTRVAAHAAIVGDVARRYRIDPRLLSAMIDTESAGRAGAVSNKGALGLMQVMPATARSLGVADPKAMLGNPALAIEAGAAYLKTLQARLGNDVPLVVAAYNAGPGAVLKAGRRVPAFRETQAYVGRVMATYAADRTTALR